jgi:hypothetical protein
MSTRSRNSKRPVVAAGPEPRPEKRRKVAGGKSLAATQAEEAASAAEKRDLAKAREASLRDGWLKQFDKYNTELLFWWGDTFANWSLDATRSGERKRVMDELIRVEAEPPADKKQILAAFKRSRNRAWTKSTEREPELPPEESEIEDDEPPEQEEEERTPAAASRVPVQRRAAGLCQHCRAPNDGSNCENCHLNPLLPISHPANVHIMSLRAQPTQGTATTKLDTAATAVSAIDKELALLAKEGADYELFHEDPISFSTPKALAIMRSSFLGADYREPSKQLVELIQCGKLSKIGLATPRPATDEVDSRTEAMGGATLTIGAAGMSWANKLKAKQVANLSELIEIIVGVIVPSLIMQPRAIMEWMALLRTASRLGTKYPWEHVMGYVNKTLSHAVAKRIPFGPTDKDALDALREHTCSAVNLQRRAASPPRLEDRPCMWYNKRAGCHKANCPFKHRCSVPGCKLTHPAFEHAPPASPRVHFDAKSVGTKAPFERRSALKAKAADHFVKTE